MESILLLLVVVALLAVGPSFARGESEPPVTLELLETAAPSASASDDSDDTSPVDDARLIAELRAAEAMKAYGPVPDFNRRFEVRRTRRAPEIDGRLDEPAWKNARVLKDFFVAQAVNDTSLPKPAGDQTEARVLFDSRGLYVGVRAFQDMDTLYTSTEKNGLMRPDLDWEHGSEPWANTGCDEIEIVIDPELTRTSYFVFQVNPDGVMRKLFMPAARVYDGHYKRIDPIIVADDAWKAAVSRDTESWSAEIFIPFESIGMRPMKSADAGHVYFDMVQDRTVMGFNVNRISHEKDEPSSWSPSRAPMFFTDAENFGHAYFRQMPAAIADVSHGDFFNGENSFTLDLVSRESEDRRFDVSLTVKGDGYAEEKRKRVSIPAGKTASVTFDFAETPPGAYRIDARLLGKKDYIIDRTTYVFETPAPLEIVALKSILFEGESDFPVRTLVNMPGGSADTIRFRVLSGRKVLAEESCPVPGGRESVLPFEVAGLSAGDYAFEAAAFKGKDKKAATTAALTVLESPYAMNLTGTAGKSAPAEKGTPKGFAVLADGDGQRNRDVAVKTDAAWVDESLRRKGYALYAVTPTDDFASWRGQMETPRRTQLAAPIRAFAAGGEYEAVSFAVLAFEALKNPHVEFSQLTSSTGGSIAKSRMDLRAERGDMFLVKENVLGGIPAGTARRYLLTIRVAEGTPAGLYEGTLTFSADNRERETRKYELLVLPFALGEAAITSSAYGHLDGTDRDGPVAADLLAHGLDNFTCNGVLKGDFSAKGMIHHVIWGVDKPTQENWMGDDLQTVSPELDENIFKNIARHGLRGPIVVDVNLFLRYRPPTEETAELFEKFLIEVESLRRQYELPEFVYHLVDEPNNHYTYDDGRYGRRYGLLRVNYFGKVLAKLGLRQYVTINSTQKGYDVAGKFPDECDIWCPNYIIDEALVEQWSTGGKEIWLYNYAGDGRCKGAMRSTYGFYAPRVKATGVTIWHHPNFVRWDREAGKCIDSSAWEAVREGIDDARYMDVLKKAVETARASGARKAALADEAAGALEDIIAAYPVATNEKVVFERRHDADQWNKWRWIVASWILKLS